MPTFTEQIQSLVGAVDAYWTDDLLDSSLSDGAKDIIRRISSSNPEDIWLFTESSTVTGSGKSVGSAKIYDVSRGNKPCKFVPVTKRHRAKEADSIEYATSEFPIYYLLDGKVFVLPEPGAGSDIAISTFATNDSGNKTKITTGTAHGFNEQDHIVITQSDIVLNDIYYIGSFYIYDIIDSTNFIIDRDYQAAAVTGYTVSEPTAAVQHLSFPSVDASISSINSFPESYYPLVVTYGAMAVLMRTMSEVHNRTPELVLPVAPIAPDISTVSDDIPTFTPPAAFVMPSAPDDADVGSLSGITQTATFPTLENIVIPTLTFPIDSISINTLDLGVELPVPPESPAFDRGTTSFSYVRGVAPQYIKPVFSPPTFPTLTALELPALPTPIEIGTIPDGQTNQAGSNLAEYPIPVINAPDWDSLDTSIVDEDVEVAGIKLNKIQAQVSIYTADLQRAGAKFNKESTEYEKRIEEAIANSRMSLESNNQGLQAKLSLYSAQVQSYTAESQNVLAKWGRENIDNKYTRWVTEYANTLQEYQQNISQALNKFNEEQSVYQVEVGKAMQDATNQMTSETNEYQAKAGIYQQDLAAYQARTAHIVTDWQTRIAQTAVTEFTQKRADALQEWSTTVSSLISKYQNEVGYVNQKFGGELQAWQQLVNQKLQIYQAETGYDIQLFTQRVTTETQRYQADLGKEDTKFKNDIDKYKMQSGEVRAENQENMAVYAADTQIWTGESGNVLNEFNAQITKLGQEYQWYQDKMAGLRGQYEAGFIMSPQAQKQQQEGA